MYLNFKVLIVSDILETSNNVNPLKKFSPKRLIFIKLFELTNYSFYKSKLSEKYSAKEY